MTKTNTPDIEELASITEGLVTTFADLAIGESDSYKEAIDLVHENASLTIHGQAMKKAIQDRITERALNSKVEKETLSLTGYRSEGERGISGCPDGRATYLRTAWANSDDGRVDFSVFNSGGRSYIGVYQSFGSTVSFNPSDYTWYHLGDPGTCGGSRGIQ